ncbi:MAG: peptide chain release factor 1 [Candidatus Gracilibacteria bacterium]|nr:peptide chain release factor 1 [Candidatus Gracilibacteria bacterium]
MKFNLDALVVEYENLETQLSDPSIFSDQKKVKEVSSRKKAISEAVNLYKEYKQAHVSLDEAKMILDTESDEEMRELAKMEREEAESKIEDLEQKIKISLLPKDEDDDKNIIVEVKAGTGGEEAALFAGELARAYLVFAEAEGFKTEIVEQSESENGGYRELVFEVKGDGAYRKFKYEAGVHRVQRIPETESKGRVHTSAITVAILPEVEEVDVEIKESDLEIKACRASGAGGQHVNKTDSAIHMVHIPTGVAVFVQEGRSQHKNKERALQIIRSKIYQAEQERISRERGEERLSQVGSGDRSEKIRTYNFPQDRVTDHRIGQNFSGIPQIMAGKLGHIVEALALADEQQKLEKASGLEE